MHRHAHPSFGGPLVAIFLIGVIVAGCNQPSTSDDATQSSTNIAVCDLDKVAEAMGYRQDIRDRLADGDAQLMEQLQSEKKKLEDQLKERQEKVGDKPTTKQQEEQSQLVASPGSDSGSGIHNSITVGR